jgi:hypothetical protein
MEGFNADKALLDSETDDSELEDINTDADLWGGMPQPSTA